MARSYDRWRSPFDPYPPRRASGRVFRDPIFDVHPGARRMPQGFEDEVALRDARRRAALDRQAMDPRRAYGQRRAPVDQDLVMDPRGLGGRRMPLDRSSTDPRRAYQARSAPARTEPAEPTRAHASRLGALEMPLDLPLDGYRDRAAVRSRRQAEVAPPPEEPRRPDVHDAVDAAEAARPSAEAAPAPAATPAPAEPPLSIDAAELERLRQENRELRAALEQATARGPETHQSARVAAAQVRQAEVELERAKERIAREARKDVDKNRRDMLVRFLDVLDDLDRALAATPEDADPALRQGVELVRKRYLDTLGSFGVTHVPSMGEPFDPAIHDAIARVPVPEPERDGTVVGVVREGYAMGDQVLRPASVAVGQARPGTERALDPVRA